jgi:hypothetical protein
MMQTEITAIDSGILLCRVFRYHRWVPVAARAGLVAGARVWDWELRCETGCGNKATEWIDDFGFRVPGTKRQYTPSEAWHYSAGYDNHEYVAEYIRRQVEATETAKKVKRAANRKPRAVAR